VPEEDLGGIDEGEETAMPIAPQTGHILQAPQDVPLVDFKNGWLHTCFLGVRKDPSSGPEAFLCDCPPGGGIDSHFHAIDQFQVMYGGPGTYYQRHELPKTLLHYADAYTVYGPFGAGPESGMRFFTLRPVASELHGGMPEHRADLLYRGERHFEYDLDKLLDEGAPAKGEVTVDTLIEEKADGLAAYLLRIGAGAAATPPKGELRTGRYTVVLEGELSYEGRSFGPTSLGWSSGEIEEMALHGGPGGAAVLFLYLPYPSTASVRLKSA
jgi:hypothetical protein